MQVKGSTEVRKIPCDKESLVDLVHQSLQGKLDDNKEALQAVQVSVSNVENFAWVGVLLSNLPQT